MKEAYYFSHDSNARHDPKITAMRAAYGATGYGWFWVLIEMMRESDEYQLKMKGKYSFNAFALQMQSNTDEAKKFIDDCIHEFELFESNDQFFWSPSLLRRMSKREEKSGKARAAAQVRWGKESELDANAMQTHSERNALKESKVNESKENKKNYAEFVSMKESQYQKLVDNHGEKTTQRMIEILDNYKGSTGKKYKDDYRAVLSWVVKRVNSDNESKFSSKSDKSKEVLQEMWGEADEQETGSSTLKPGNDSLPKS